MIISIRTLRQKLQRMKEKGTPVKGFAAVLSVPTDFSTLNGYIEFAWATYCHILRPLPENDWKTVVDKVMQTLLCLKDTEYDPDACTFQEYAEKMSAVTDRPYAEDITDKKPIAVIRYYDEKIKDLEKEMPEDTRWCFWNEESDNESVENYLNHEFMEQLAGLKMEKSTSDESINISMHARDYHGTIYHEEIVTMANMLIQELVWCINATSTRTMTVNDFDTYNVNNDLERIQCIIEHIKYLT